MNESSYQNEVCDHGGGHTDHDYVSFDDDEDTVVDFGMDESSNDHSNHEHVWVQSSSSSSSSSESSVDMLSDMESLAIVPISPMMPSTYRAPSPDTQAVMIQLPQLLERQPPPTPQKQQIDGDEIICSTPPTMPKRKVSFESLDMETGVDTLLDLFYATMEKAVSGNDSGSPVLRLHQDVHPASEQNDDPPKQEPAKVDSSSKNELESLSKTNDYRMQLALQMSVGSFTTIESLDTLKSASESVIKEDLYSVLSSCMIDDDDALLNHILDDDFQPSDDSIEASIAIMTAKIDADLDREIMEFKEQQDRDEREKEDHSSSSLVDTLTVEQGNVPIPSDQSLLHQLLDVESQSFESSDGVSVLPHSALQLILPPEYPSTSTILSLAPPTEQQSTPSTQQSGSTAALASPSASTPIVSSKRQRDPHSRNEFLLRCCVVYILPFTYKVTSQLPNVFFLLELVESYEVDVKLAGIFLSLTYTCRVIQLVQCREAAREWSVYGSVIALMGFIMILLASAIRSNSNATIFFFLFGNVIVGFGEINASLQIFVKELYLDATIESLNTVSEYLTTQVAVMRFATIVAYALGGVVYEFLDITGVSVLGVLLLISQLAGIVAINHFVSSSRRVMFMSSHATTAATAVEESHEYIKLLSQRIQHREQQKLNGADSPSLFIPIDGVDDPDSHDEMRSSDEQTLDPISNASSGFASSSAALTNDDISVTTVQSVADEEVQEERFHSVMPTDLSTINEAIEESDRLDESQISGDLDEIDDEVTQLSSPMNCVANSPENGLDTVPSDDVLPIEDTHLMMSIENLASTLNDDEDPNDILSVAGYEDESCQSSAQTTIDVDQIIISKFQLTKQIASSECTNAASNAHATDEMDTVGDEEEPQQELSPRTKPAESDNVESLQSYLIIPNRQQRSLHGISPSTLNSIPTTVLPESNSHGDIDLSLSAILSTYDSEDDPLLWIDVYVAFAVSFQRIMNGLIFCTGSLVLYEHYDQSKSMIGVIYACSALCGVVASQVPNSSAWVNLIQRKLPSPNHFFFFLFICTYLTLLTAMPFFGAFIVGFLLVNFALTLFVHFLTDLQGRAADSAKYKRLDRYGQKFRQISGLFILLVAPILYDATPHLPNIVGSCICFLFTVGIYIGFETDQSGSLGDIPTTFIPLISVDDNENDHALSDLVTRIHVNYAVREAMIENNL